MNLNQCREKIDSIDTQILVLLNRRAVLVKCIGAIKAAAGLPIVDAEREDAILRSVSRDNPGDMSDEAALRIYRQILDESRKLQVENAAMKNGEPTK